jgi:hypothetical protein
MDPTTYFVQPLSVDCAFWIDSNVDQETIFGTSIPIDRVLIRDIISELRINGFQHGEDFLIINNRG